MGPAMFIGTFTIYKHYVRSERTAASASGSIGIPTFATQADKLLHQGIVLAEKVQRRRSDAH